MKIESTATLPFGLPESKKSRSSCCRSIGVSYSRQAVQCILLSELKSTQFIQH